MKKVCLKLSIALLIISKSGTIFSQNVAINSSGNAGNMAAILDLSDTSNNKLGFAMTNVDLTDVSLASPVTLPPTGLIVWNTNTPTTTVGGSGAGFYYWANSKWNYIFNSGSGGPVGSVLSNSAANTPAWTLSPAANNQILLSNASGVPTWSGAGTLAGIKVFTTSTYTYTPDAGTNAILVRMVGGGGGGGGGAALTAPGGEGGGGGAGAYCVVYVSGVVFTANYYTGTVGQGGSGGSNTPTAGSAGTSTTFSVNVTGYTANGGSGGALGSNLNSNCNSNAGGAGGSASVMGGSLVLSLAGCSGGYGLSNSMVGSVSESGINILGNFVLSSITAVSWGTGVSGAGGNSVFGGQGQPVGGNATAGQAAAANTGSGGSGGSANYEGSNISSNGGAGAAGIVIIYEYR